MRFITIRHDKSMNNTLSEISFEEYLKNRSHDPDITSECEGNCKKIAKFLKDNNFNIKKFYTSGHLRALKTMSFIVKEYNPELPQEYFPEIFERGGIYLEDKGYPGLNKSQIQDQFPSIHIPETVDITDGWYNKPLKETNEEFRERIKKSLNILREMAVKTPTKEGEEEYTICLVTHNTFLNGFYSLLNSFDFYVDNHTISHTNLGISSFTISEKKEIKVEFLNYSVL